MISLFVVPLISGCVSSVAGAVAVVVTRVSGQRTNRIGMRLAADLDREHVHMVMQVQEQWGDSGLADCGRPGWRGGNSVARGEPGRF